MDQDSTIQRRFGPWNLPFDPRLLVVAGLGLVAAMLVTTSGYVAVFAMVAVGGGLACLRRPLAAISLLLFLVPFTNMDFFTQNIINVTGGKAINLLGLFVLGIALFNMSRAQPMPRRAAAFFICYLVLFVAAVLRALPHLDMINFVLQEQLTPARYMLSFLFKPFVFLLPCLLAVWFVKTEEDVRLVVNILTASLTVLSVFILYHIVMETGVTGDIREIDEFYSTFLGQHRNSLADFYIVGLPVVLAQAFRKRSLWMLGILGLTLVVLGLLFSRTAYLVSIISFVLYFALSRRTKWLPLLVFLAACGSLVLSSAIVERALHGLEDGDRQVILAGRVDNLWLPLVEEVSRNPVEFIVGRGRHAIASSESAQKGMILEATHPHNMYLEQVLDTGLLGLLITMGFLLLLLKGAFEVVRRNPLSERNEYLVAFIVGIVGYCIAGLTGRTLFPLLSNSFFWLLVGLTVVILWRPEQEGKRADGKA